jgi:hypothetical protein
VHGHPPLIYEQYVQVLFSTYDSQFSSGDQKKHAVYQSKLDPDLDPYDDIDYAAYSVDTNVADIMAYVICMTPLDLIAKVVTIVLAIKKG